MEIQASNKVLEKIADILSLEEVESQVERFFLYADVKTYRIIDPANCSLCDRFYNEFCSGCPYNRISTKNYSTSYGCMVPKFQEGYYEWVLNRLSLYTAIYMYKLEK